MLYNHYDKPNHNQESKFSPLNDPGMKVYPIQSIYYRPKPIKVFPCYTSVNNVAFPEYLKLPTLPDSGYTVDPYLKPRQRKQFGNNSKTGRIFNIDNMPERIRGKRCNYTLSRSNEYDNKEDLQGHQERQLTAIDSDCNNKHYQLRKYDIISNREYIPLKYIGIVPEKNYFSNLLKINRYIANDNELRRIANRYRKLNGGQYARLLNKIIPPKFNVY